MKQKPIQKLYPNELSRKEKAIFYSQEIFQDQSANKIYILIISIVLIGVDKIGDIWIFPKLTEKPDPENKWHLFILLAAFLLYVLSFVIYQNQKSHQALNMRLLLNFSACSLLAAYLTLENIASIEQAIKSADKNDWAVTLQDYSNSICYTVLVSLLVPPWYLRVIIPSSYCLSLIIAGFKLDHPVEYWILARMCVSILIIVILMFLQSKSRWRLFIKNLETQGWNQIYRDILSNLSYAICVITANGELMYSNHEFNILMSTKNQNQHELFQSISDLKARLLISKPLSLNSAPKTIGSTIQNSKKKSKHSKMSFTENQGEIQNYLLLEDLQESATLLELIKKIQLLLENPQKVIDQKYLVYDGKLHSKASSQSISYEIKLYPLYEYKKLIIVLNDTTQRDLIASAQENNQYKNRLLASVSHNLRTPLNGTLTFLQSAFNDNRLCTSVKNELIVPAIRSGTLLLNMINDILDYSLIQSNELQLSLESKPLYETLKNAFDLLKSSFKAKGLQYQFEIDENIPKVFCTDHQRITQIILNLLGNALKFTFEGKVLLKATFIQTGKIRIDVEDTGMGMTPQEMEALKEELANPLIALSTAQKSKGIGLGLKISHDLLKKIEDTETSQGIQFQSCKDMGSRFYFVLNDQAAATTNMSLAYLKSNADKSYLNLDISEEIHQENFRKYHPVLQEKYNSQFKTLSIKNFTTSSIFSTEQCVKTTQDDLPISKDILVVDDDAMNILGLKLLLTKLDFTVDACYNGQQAIQKVKTKFDSEHNKFKLIFMDCQMPIMDGFEASRILRKMMQTGEIPTVPIIGCTAFTDKKKLEECLASGMDTVISKPVSLNKIKEIVEKYNNNNS